MTLIYRGAPDLLDQPSTGASGVQQILAAAVRAFLLAGLWTPVFAVLAALDQIWIALFASSPTGAWANILLGAFCASLAMLGPGAWSIDARLFGRRSFPTLPARSKYPPRE